MTLSSRSAAWVALALRDAGIPSAILSRGYGRRNPEQTLLVSGGRGAPGVAARSGDEPEWLGSKASGVPVSTQQSGSADPPLKSKFLSVRFLGFPSFLRSATMNFPQI